MELHNIYHIAIQIAQAAGQLLRDGYNQHKQIRHKSTSVDLVTQYDTAAEQLILRELSAHFPDHHFIAEESGDHPSHSPYHWHIDPLDGTTNFAHGFPVFAVSLALYHKTEPLIGVVYDPLREECFSAIKGEGAYLSHNGPPSRLYVSSTNQLLHSLLATGFPYDRHTNPYNNIAQLAILLTHTQGIRRAGAAALDLAYVAAGRLDGYWEYRLNSWDVAAGALLVKEAGGIVTTPQGTPFSLTPRLSLIASNGLIHNEIIKTLNSKL